jgi:tRNA pseudouridine55 synthase
MMHSNAPRYRPLTQPKVSDPFDGVLLVNKPSGPTSHDIVAQIRRRFKIKKVGHGGTLDPQATGLLVILLGKGTKLSNRMISSDKTYTGKISLGVATDSQDAQGKVLSEADCSAITREALEGEMQKLVGDIMQTPPMVSAVKIDGVPLYKRARRGETVKREPKLVHIYEFALTSYDNPDSDFLVRCTKGTYVRTLCYDIGESLGCGAHLKELCRTHAGEFELKDASEMDDIMKMDNSQLIDVLLPLHELMKTIR